MVDHQEAQPSPVSADRLPTTCRPLSHPPRLRMFDLPNVLSISRAIVFGPIARMKWMFVLRYLTYIHVRPRFVWGVIFRRHEPDSDQRYTSGGHSQNCLGEQGY
jgi:hypothetical protein